ncbi:MAG: heme NO-binding domain-containing protein [Polyangia bacterium]
MKGVFVICLEELACKRWGADVWGRALQRAGMEGDEMFVATRDVPDELAMGMFEAVCREAGIERSELAGEFGRYWIDEFAPRFYRMYYECVASVREFLLQLDEVHRQTTEFIAGADPPRFEYEWKDDDLLEMRYVSSRGLLDFAAELVASAGRHFGEPLDVTRIGEDRLRIRFSQPG